MLRQSEQLYKVAGDGNCGFRCLAVFEYKNESQYLQVKANTVNILYGIKNDYEMEGMLKEWQSMFEIATKNGYIKSIFFYLHYCAITS